MLFQPSHITGRFLHFLDGVMRQCQNIYFIPFPQIEAALSRIPGAGARVTLQTRLDQVDDPKQNKLQIMSGSFASGRFNL